MCHFFMLDPLPGIGQTQKHEASSMTCRNVCDFSHLQLEVTSPEIESHMWRHVEVGQDAPGLQDHS